MLRKDCAVLVIKKMGARLVMGVDANADTDGKVTRSLQWCRWRRGKFKERAERGALENGVMSRKVERRI